MNKHQFKLAGSTLMFAEQIVAHDSTRQASWPTTRTALVEMDKLLQHLGQPRPYFLGQMCQFLLNVDQESFTALARGFDFEPLYAALDDYCTEAKIHP